MSLVMSHYKWIVLEVHKCLVLEVHKYLNFEQKRNVTEKWGWVAYTIQSRATYHAKGGWLLPLRACSSQPRPPAQGPKSAYVSCLDARQP